MTYLLWNRIIVRGKPLIGVLVTVAAVVAAHRDLLHLPAVWNDRVELLGLLIVALHNAPIGRFVEPRQESV